MAARKTTRPAAPQMTLEERFAGCSPDFQSMVRSKAAECGLGWQDVYRLWRLYSTDCRSGDQSAIWGEFLDWYKDKLKPINGHTAGPWLVNKNANGTFDIVANHELAFELATLDIHPNAREHLANANLIAAAPELLAALQLATLGVMDPEARRLANAVIAKATGKAGG